MTLTKYKSALKNKSGFLHKSDMNLKQNSPCSMMAKRTILIPLSFCRWHVNSNFSFSFKARREKKWPSGWQQNQTSTRIISLGHTTQINPKNRYYLACKRGPFIAYKMMLAQSAWGRRFCYQLERWMWFCQPSTAPM